MTRVKMNAKHEYEFIANFKILQNIFRGHKLDKVLGVENRHACLGNGQQDLTRCPSRYRWRGL